MDPALGLSGGLAVGVLAGVRVGVLAGVLVEGVVAGLLVFPVMSSKRSFGSWGMFFNFSAEPAVQMYLWVLSIFVGVQVQREFWNLTSMLYLTPW